METTPTAFHIVAQGRAAHPGSGSVSKTYPERVIQGSNICPPFV